MKEGGSLSLITDTYLYIFIESSSVAPPIACGIVTDIQCKCKVKKYVCKDFCF